MSKKRRPQNAIGFDDTLNGFQTWNEHHPFLIMTGYIEENGRGYGTPKYGSKRNRNFLGKRRKGIEEVLKCGRPFLEKYSDFLYVVIPEIAIDSPKKLYELKAESIALMTLRFFETRPDLTPQNTELYIDETDGKVNSKYLNTVLGYFLRDSGLSELKHKSLVRGEMGKDVIKKADMIGYYLASMKLIGKSKRWPHMQKRMHLSNLRAEIFNTNDRRNH